MSATKQDYLGNACDLGGLSASQFQAAFCSQCKQPECTRSQFTKSKFETRVETWEERLFTDVPRMDPSDPRFQAIASAKFIAVDLSAPKVVSEWVDPNEVKATSIVVPSAPKTRNLPVLNTPVRSGIMLQGAPPVKPEEDSWAAPATPKGNVVKPGAKIKLGS